jgi:hypothetical protein
VQEVELRKSYLGINLLWLVGALVMFYLALPGIQGAIPNDLVVPNPDAVSFSPLAGLTGYERIFLRIDGLKFQFWIVMFLILKNYFILARNPFSVIGNYLLLSIIFPLCIYYGKWSSEFVGCKDCSTSISPFFPSQNWSGTLFLLILIFVLFFEMAFFILLLIKSKTMNSKPG